MTTIARQANLRIADHTAVLAQLVINARFAAIVADIDFPAVTIDADVEPEHDYHCEICGEGTDFLYTRLDEDGDEVEACETCVDTYRLAYAAD